MHVPTVVAESNRSPKGGAIKKAGKEMLFLAKQNPVQRSMTEEKKKKLGEGRREKGERDGNRKTIFCLVIKRHAKSKIEGG